MIFRWLRNRRRRQLLAQPFPKALHAILRADVRHYAALNPDQQSKVNGDLRIFVTEKNWEGCGGLKITDDIKVTIAAQIAILTLGFDGQYFDNVLSILVHPDAYVAPDQSITKGGVVMESKSNREGEAWYRGPVILSWADALASAQGKSRGHNLVVHEFAHQLDMLNGRSADGIPPMESNKQAERWIATPESEYKKLCHDCEHHRHTVLDCYGTTNKAEFFAVATEAFFEQPVKLKHHHTQLFTNLCEYYRQDTTG